jgi:uncharacterized membrane protein
MNCKSIKKLLYLYFDKEIKNSKIKRIEEHLLICQRCKDLKNNIHTIINFLNKCKREELPDDFTDLVIQRIKNCKIILETEKLPILLCKFFFKLFYPLKYISYAFSKIKFETFYLTYSSFK